MDFVVVGCGPAGATAAREAARCGVETVVLEKDAIVGAKRVCAAGLRPGFCETFDLPREIVHCDTPRLALFDADGMEHEVIFGPGHTTTREELDGTMARLAAKEGAEIRTQALFRGFATDARSTTVEYADYQTGERRRIAARSVFLAQGATAQLESSTPFAYDAWPRGLMTTLQYRVYLDRPAKPIAYRTLELHYYPAADGRQLVAWMFPKRDHLAIGLGLVGKLEGRQLRAELDAFTARVRARLYPDAGITHTKLEGHLLYGGAPRPSVVSRGVMLGGTAAGLVDATNGEGIFEAAMSGRLVAEALSAHRNDALAAARRYGNALRHRFSGRLVRRLQLMNFLAHSPQRYRILFEQLAHSRRLSDTLQQENRERTLADRVFLYSQAFGLALRTVFA